MSKSSRARLTFWLTPTLGVVIGAAFLAAAWASGQRWLGVALLALMMVFSGAVVAASWRSETVRGLLDRRDEWIVSIDLRATAAAGLALTVAVIIGGFVELARGHSGAPFTWLAAVAAATYVIIVVVERLRR
jgi:hypothetical protein